METKIISIDISPDTISQGVSQDAGVMWEHNATKLVFNIDPCYIGDYRYYLEYRSLLGTKVRTEYLTLNTENNTVAYNIPVAMTSLKGVECYFNIISIDGDGNTTQVIKAYKFCLRFDYSPDTDNSLAKTNDFSINALLEAIRLGTFKGDKGDVGEIGEKGEKGDKGDVGEVTTEYANSSFANAVRKQVSGNPILIDDVSPLEHKLNIKTAPNKNVYLRGKNLIPFDDLSYNNGQYKAGKSYTLNGVSFTINDDGSVKVIGTATNPITFLLYSSSLYAKGKNTITLSGAPSGSSATTYCLRFKNGDDAYSNYEDYGEGRVIENVDVTHSNVYIVVFAGQSVDTVFKPQIEFGVKATEYSIPVNSFKGVANESGDVEGVRSVSSKLSIFGDENIECSYNQDTAQLIQEQFEEMKTMVDKQKYRLINSVTFDKDSQLATFSTDLAGESIKKLGLNKVFILFVGNFVNTTNSQPLCVLFNDGGVYQMYKSFNIVSGTRYGFWLESEKIASFDEYIMYKSNYSSTLLRDFNATTVSAQGLSANNVAVSSDLSVTKNSIEKVTFGSFNTNNLIKAGSKVFLFGM